MLLTLSRHVKCPAERLTASKAKFPKQLIGPVGNERRKGSHEEKECSLGHARPIQPLVSHRSIMTLVRSIIVEFARRNKMFRKMFPDFTYELERVLSDCKSNDCNSVLDLGCGSSSPLKFLSRKSYSVGVDLFEPAIEKSRREGIHNEYILMDVRDIGERFQQKSFDCVVALDLIEHLDKDEGIRLIEMMERIASKKVVLITPNGFLAQKEFDGNTLMAHRSGWTVKEMRSRGYRVIGINGWKWLIEGGRLRFPPEIFCAFIFRLTPLLVRNRPENASVILCVKDLE